MMKYVPAVGVYAWAILPREYRARFRQLGYVSPPERMLVIVRHRQSDESSGVHYNVEVAEGDLLGSIIQVPAVYLRPYALSQVM